MGHLNPTLPLVRALVDGGHEVHFMCAEMAKAKIEAAARTSPLWGGIEGTSERFASEIEWERARVAREMPRHRCDLASEFVGFGAEAGAIFHDIMEIQAELYMGREKGCQAIFQLMQELQLEMCFLNVLKCLNVSLLQELPGTLRFMQALAPQASGLGSTGSARAARWWSTTR